MPSLFSRLNRRRGERPDPTKASAPAAPAAPRKRRAPVFRVRGVPPDLDRASLLALLESHNDLSGCGIGIHTLAVDIDGRQVATIFFTEDKIPPRLKALERHRAAAVEIPVEIPVDGAPRSHPAAVERSGDGPQTVKLSVDRLLLGLTTLYMPEKNNHHFDVLAVHGLGGSHPYGSFVSRETGHMWLKDDLPRVIPSARIIIYGYDTKLAKNNDCVQVDDLGSSLFLEMVNLWQEAQSAPTKPLVLIGLSLGGLLVKEALIRLSESKLWSELGTVRGVLLFGTPNDGMRMESFRQIVKDNSNRLMLETLNSLNSHFLETQNPVFHKLQCRASFEVFCFWERLPSPAAKMKPGGGDDDYSMDGELGHLVTKTSATSCLLSGAPKERKIGMRTDHSGLVKFNSNDPNFEKVKPILVHMCGPGRGAAATDSLPALTEAQKECQAALYFTQRKPPSRESDDNTGKWLFTHEEYKRWHSCPGGLLWVKGIAGSGKSTLLRQTLKRIKALPSAGKPPLVLDFFFDRQGCALQKSPVGLFRSLLHQILTRVPHVLAAFVNDFQQRSAAEKQPPDDAAKWSDDDLRAALRSSLAAVLQERPVWLLVDALDEADDEAAAVGVVHEFKTLLDGVKVSAGDFPLRIIFTARPHLVRDDEYRFKVTVQDNNNTDIADWVKQRFSTNRELKKSKVGELITVRAGGLFLWASLIVERAHEMWRQGKGLMSIENMVCEKHAKHAKLADVYRQMLNDLVEEGHGLAQKLFLWICFAKRPLTLDEVKWALIVDAKCSYRSLADCKGHGEFYSEMARRVVYISRGLVEIEPSSSPSSSAQHVVRFIHQTVPDFLLREGGLASILHDPTLTTADVGRLAHYQLSRTCIRYLAMEEIAQSIVTARNDLAAFPLLHYATTSWVAHTEQSDQHDLPDFFHWPSEHSEQLVQRWVQIYGKIARFSEDRPPEGISLVHIVVRYNLMGALEEIVKRNVPVEILDVKNNYGRTPLLYAAERGHRAVVKRLLEKGACPNSCDYIGWTPLLHASEKGHKAVVEDLLVKKANINAQDRFGATALHWAIWRRNETIISHLLKNAADTEVTEKGGGTPLAWAIEIGSETTVRELLQGGSAVNYWYKSMPLSRAVWKGDDRIVKLLLEP
ncbi:Kinase D-interacting substrate [Beauveria bassiana]|uniref:Kinase D-interacting substrate n=1 Tax=Beauveria bassiana TaxID=176275 RepID=A0A2N6ND33_BEABA|nr:Kinase D-interacting substrate [Beauveria bassiana]